jgi:deoxyribodipyrimidine photolyase-related protein
MEISFVANPGILTPLPETSAFLYSKKQYFQTDFYVWQRKRMGLLLEGNGKPLGGKWTYDSDNRQRYPKGMQPPRVQWPNPNMHVAEAQQYVETHFANNPGRLNPVISIGLENCFYPVTHAEARQWLNDFLQHRFAEFGPYEDAMVASERFLHHSVLTPMLNIGLLTPAEVLDAALVYASENDIPLQSLEGFVRQIIGWREFIRLVYLREGPKQRTNNYWGFTRKIPAAFYTGHTGIEPIDIVIRKTLESGYCHHIERLMVLGNFMLLCEFDPDEVYRWFMELFIDAYDWVMVPNVYGMTQFADGGLMTTKPYISGSAYLLKMGDWQKGPWQQTWDGLFWHFMDKQRAFFSKNPRLGMLLNTFDKMDAAKRNNHLLHATNYLASL